MSRHLRESQGRQLRQPQNLVLIDQRDETVWAQCFSTYWTLISRLMCSLRYTTWQPGGPAPAPRACATPQRGCGMLASTLLVLASAQMLAGGAPDSLERGCILSGACEGEDYKIIRLPAAGLWKSPCRDGRFPCRPVKSVCSGPLWRVFTSGRLWVHVQ